MTASQIIDACGYDTRDPSVASYLFLMRKDGIIKGEYVKNPNYGKVRGAKLQVYAYSIVERGEQIEGVEAHTTQPLILTPEQIRTFTECGIAPGGADELVRQHDPANLEAGSENLQIANCATCDKLNGLGAELGMLLQAGPAHPLQQVFDLAIHHLTQGKGERHGGSSVGFMEQQWVALADDYGVGGLYFQANKKLREAQKKTGETRQRELVGALNYLAMGILYEWIKGAANVTE